MNRQDILDTWSEGPGGMLTCADPVMGGIIDRTLLDEEWFVIFNDDELAMLDGFACRDDALNAAQEAFACLT